MTRDVPSIAGVAAQAYEVPTDQPEADGTLAWSSTSVVLVRIVAASAEGIGWTYAGGVGGGTCTMSTPPFPGESRLAG